MIDLHSHLLPGVDDGSRSVDQSLRVLKSFRERGVHTVAFTPHLLASQLADGVPEVQEEAWLKIAPVIPDEITVVRGAEVMLDRPLPREAAERRVTLAGTRYLLVEFPRMVPAEIVRRALHEVTTHGLVPVLAHPERYSSCSVEAAREWQRVGAVLQVDATTLTLPRSRGDRARALVAAGLADILAADNHGDDRCIATALEWLNENEGEEQAIILLESNPRAILEDRALFEVEPLPLRTSWWSRVRNLLEER